MLPLYRGTSWSSERLIFLLRVTQQVTDGAKSRIQVCQSRHIPVPLHPGDVYPFCSVVPTFSHSNWSPGNPEPPVKSVLLYFCYKALPFSHCSLTPIKHQRSSSNILEYLARSSAHLLHCIGCECFKDGPFITPAQRKKVAPGPSSRP